MPVLIATVALSLQAATPTFSPAGGTYAGGSVAFTLVCTTPSNSMYYTSDGSTPSPTNGTIYTGPVTDSTLGATTFKAIAVAAGYTESAVASVVYTVVEVAAATPTFSPPAGTYSVAQSVVANSQAGATIYYTTDGTTPVT